MAITGYGFDGSIDETRWSQLFASTAANAPSQESVLTGFAPSPGAGTRVLSVAAGRASAAGVLADGVGATTITLDATPVGRVSLVCVEFNWTTNTASLVDVKGVAGSIESSVLPALTRTPGVLWQLPIARVEVPSGVGAFSAGHIDDVRPLGNTGWVNTTPSGGFALPGTNPLRVRRRGPMVEMHGRLQRTNTAMSVGTSATMGGVSLIPDGFRPSADVLTTGWTNFGTSAIRSHPMIVRAPIGDVELFAGSGAIAQNDSIFFSATWLTEV